MIHLSNLYRPFIYMILACCVLVSCKTKSRRIKSHPQAGKSIYPTIQKKLKTGNQPSDLKVKTELSVDKTACSPSLKIQYTSEKATSYYIRFCSGSTCLPKKGSVLKDNLLWMPVVFDSQLPDLEPLRGQMLTLHVRPCSDSWTICGPTTNSSPILLPDSKCSDPREAKERAMISKKAEAQYHKIHTITKELYTRSCQLKDTLEDARAKATATNICNGGLDLYEQSLLSYFEELRNRKSDSIDSQLAENNARSEPIASDYKFSSWQEAKAYYDKLIVSGNERKKSDYFATTLAGVSLFLGALSLSIGAVKFGKYAANKISKVLPKKTQPSSPTAQSTEKAKKKKTKKKKHTKTSSKGRGQSKKPRPPKTKKSKMRKLGIGGALVGGALAFATASSAEYSKGGMHSLASDNTNMSEIDFQYYKYLHNQEIRLNDEISILKYIERMALVQK